jgi:putative ABC transport system permease protein
MSMFRVLNLRYLRRQPLRAFLSIVAIAAAVAVTVGSVVLIESLDRSVLEAVRSMSGPAPVRVLGPLTRGGINPSTLRAVQGTEGVETAVPVVQAVTAAHTTSDEPTYVLALGVDCRVESLIGAFGCEGSSLSGDGPALVSSRLIGEVGKDADIRTDAGRVPIGDAVVNDALDEFNGGRIAIFDLAVAQKVFDRGEQVDAIYVKPASGVDVAELKADLQRAVGPQNFVLGRGESPPWMQMKGPLIPLLVLATAMSLALSFVLIYNILSLSLAERRRDLAVASAIGTKPTSLVGGVVAECGLLGLAGGILGIGGGLLLSPVLVYQFASAITEQASGVRMQVHVPMRAYVIGVLIGIAVGAVSAIVPARRGMKLDLAAELHGRASLEEERPKRAVLRSGVLLAICAITVLLSYIAQRGAALESWQPPLGGISLIAASVLSFAAAGGLAAPLLSVVLRGLRSSGGPLRIAVANLVRNPRRARVIATGVGAAVGMACVLGALIPASRGTIAASDLGSLEGRVSVRTLPLNNSGNTDARPSAALLRKLESVPGVAGVDGGWEQEVSDTRGEYEVIASETMRRATYGHVRGDTSLAALQRGEAIVGTSLARVRGLRPGSILRIATPTGFVPVKVAGIWVNAQENGHNVTISVPLHKRMFGDHVPHDVFLRTEPGVTLTEVARNVDRAGLDPDVFALTPKEASDRLAEEVVEQGNAFWALQRTMLGVALVGTLSTLLLVGVQRRRELGILAAVGFSSRALGRMTLAEALAAGLAGSLLGILGSMVVFDVLRNAAAVSIGVRPAFTFAPMSALSATALAAVVVAIGAALPARRAARVQIVEAIRDE